MRDTEFQHWLRQSATHNPAAQSNALSRCRRVGEHEGDLDQHVAKDRMASLLARLVYSSEDERHNRPPRHSVPISKGANVWSGTASLASAVRLYLQFAQGDAIPRPSGLESGVRSPRVRSGGFAWPEWEVPTDQDLLELARITVPYIRFLNPDIVQAIVEDNSHNHSSWHDQLRERGIDPDLYLWERSSCAFPGVRRHAGSSEIAQHRRRMDTTSTHENALALDDNHYPKTVWSFVLRGKAFQNQGPIGYSLAHLADHKRYKNRSQGEFDGMDTGPSELPALFGLYTSVANTCYMPVGLIRPTDFGFVLRNLLQRQAVRLYGSFCNLLPPNLSVRANQSHEWSLDSFAWGEPVGSLEYVQAFVDFRRLEMVKLFSACKVNGIS